MIPNYLVEHYNIFYCEHKGKVEGEYNHYSLRHPSAHNLDPLCTIPRKDRVGVDTTAYKSRQEFMAVFNAFENFLGKMTGCLSICIDYYSWLYSILAPRVQ
jgi:hypothetical protein